MQKYENSTVFRMKRRGSSLVRESTFFKKQTTVFESTIIELGKKNEVDGANERDLEVRGASHRVLSSI